MEAETVKTMLDTWGIAEKIIACGFDTTSSNTGVHKGCCTVLQQLLGRQILWVACRHHILELVLKAAFTELFGDTVSPEESFFKFMKPSWTTLDLTDIRRPTIPTPFKADTASLLTFIQHRLKPEQASLLPRDDYREFLELALLILGGTPERKHGVYKIHRPGADHHARWMSKAIYTLKLTLLQHQFPDIPWHKKKKLEKMTFFILFGYMESWFRSSSLFSAANNDLNLYRRLLKFSKFHKKLSQVTLTVLQRHTWYLSEELLPLSLFDSSLPEDTLNSLAQEISSLAASSHPIQKPSLPLISPNSSLPDFLGPRSTILFSLIDVPHTFLADPQWRQSTEFQQVKAALKNLSPVNDSCERALALATTFNGLITKDEESYQELVLVVEAHRKKFKLEKKSDLKNVF